MQVYSITDAGDYHYQIKLIACGATTSTPFRFLSKAFYSLSPLKNSELRKREGRGKKEKKQKNP